MVYAWSDLLGECMTPELREVWLELYDSLSGVIMKAILDVHLERLMSTRTGHRGSSKGMPN